MVIFIIDMCFLLLHVAVSQSQVDAILTGLVCCLIRVAISHFQVYSAAIREGLRAWAEAHPGETVSREAMQGITQEAKRVASEARGRA